MLSHCHMCQFVGGCEEVAPFPSPLVTHSPPSGVPPSLGIVTLFAIYTSLLSHCKLVRDYVTPIYLTIFCKKFLSCAGYLT
jgi:hypothetical protein